MYWNYFLENKMYWPNGVTLKKLEKAEQLIMEDGILWDDILRRHKGYAYWPENMRRLKPDMFQHMIGNMGSMIRENLVRNKIIKS